MPAQASKAPDVVQILVSCFLLLLSLSLPSPYDSPLLEMDFSTKDSLNETISDGPSTDTAAPLHDEAIDGAFVNSAARIALFTKWNKAPDVGPSLQLRAASADEELRVALKELAEIQRLQKAWIEVRDALTRTRAYSHRLYFTVF